MEAGAASSLASGQHSPQMTDSASSKLWQSTSLSAVESRASQVPRVLESSDLEPAAAWSDASSSQSPSSASTSWYEQGMTSQRFWCASRAALPSRLRSQRRRCTKPRPQSSHRKVFAGLRAQARACAAQRCCAVPRSQRSAPGPSTKVAWQCSQAAFAGFLRHTSMWALRSTLPLVVNMPNVVTKVRPQYWQLNRLVGFRSQATACASLASGLVNSCPQ
mmetsp:Transcript_16215/g.47337  ORF Transcript_16215/g.47337 Transcript_16215/m.47337 type:complete len:219 (+) Transcript_16215:524-1180(+)